VRDSCIGFYSRCAQKCAKKIRGSLSMHCISQNFHELGKRLLLALGVFTVPCRRQ